MKKSSLLGFCNCGFVVGTRQHSALQIVWRKQSGSWIRRRCQTSSGPRLG
jgi:hypothetical protein